MSHQVYADIFDRLWKENRFEEAIDAYFYVGRIFERSRWVARYYEDKGQINKAMTEFEFYIESCLQISDRFLSYSSDPVDLYLLALWFETRKPWKAEKYLKLYLQADHFERTAGEGITYKADAEELLKRIQMKREPKNKKGYNMKQLLATMMTEEFQQKIKKQIKEKEIFRVRLSVCPSCGWEGKWIFNEEGKSLFCPKCHLDIIDVILEPLM